MRRLEMQEVGQEAKDFQNEPSTNGGLVPEMRAMMDRFAQAATVFGGDTYGWAEIGVRRGLVSDTPEGRQSLAEGMGLVYYLASNPDGSEKPSEEIRASELAYRLNVPEEQAQGIIDHSVDVGLIKSFVQQARQKSADRRA